jgi:hypothetical protein
METDVSEPRSTILVVYFSRTGTTRRIAEMLAAELGADIEPICEQGGNASRAGARGYLRSLIDALCRRRVRIMPALHDPSGYELVVMGSPVWASHASAPALAWLAEHGAKIRHLALFCCLGGSGAKPALEQLAGTAHRTPVATCAITTHDVHQRIDGELRQSFARKIRHKLATRLEAEWGV